MSKTVIKVENLSKQYRLGEVGTGTISHDLNRWWHRIRGKEDPYLRIGETNDRASKGSSEYVWALHDINFEVQQGEVLGIIGKNGAGKSTLLKILSKVTAPTTGSIKAKGRIASLLEVGTGFHPELTGRENIYLNGTILGMSKREVTAKLDEIVDFAGVERYLDTPVKRYSSGMMVRLGFAVAAHLEPEILIVDEVLAVGDAEFQKKAVGKMQEVSKEGGRTVLFVSHNMGTIANLCDKSVLLGHGSIIDANKTDIVINKYLSLNSNSEVYVGLSLNSSKQIFFKKIFATDINKKPCNTFKSQEEIVFSFHCEMKNLNPLYVFSFTLQDEIGQYISTTVKKISEVTQKISGNIEFDLIIDTSIISPGSYYIRAAWFIPNAEIFDLVEMICPIQIIDSGTEMSNFEGMRYGFFILKNKIITYD